MAEQKENKVEILKFDAIRIPQPNESNEKSDDKYITWGTNNLYPNHLINIYNESAIHSSIINSKANYITGDGLKYVDGDNIRLKVNAADTFDEFVSKVVKDYLIFNCFAVEVIYNTFNVPIEYHFVPVQRVRTNNNKSKFWVSKDWYNGQKPIIFDRWKIKPTESTSKIFYYDGYCPTMNKVYQIPDYFGSIPSIILESKIKAFNLNNIDNHFSVSSIITFFRGSNVADEIRNKIVNDLKASYTGAQGKKLIVDFQDPGQASADVKNLSPNDWDKAYELIGKSVKDDIMQGHQVTSPMLFGIKTEGQLGGATELETAYEIFNTTYIRNKRNELLSAFNVLFSDSELIKGRLEFAEKQLFSARISEELKAKIYTINELRNEAGLPNLADGDKLLNEVPHISESLPTAPPAAPKAFTATESMSLSEADFDKIKDFGLYADEFELIDEGDFIKTKQDFSKVQMDFEDKTDIGDYIIENDVSGKSVKELKISIRKDLGINVSIDELKDILGQLNKAGIAKIEIGADDKVKVTKPTAKEPAKKIEVMYSYTVRPGYGAPIEDKTRPFCKKLIENNRFYTMAEVQTMTSIFGYDIFQYGGGWYRNPTTQELTSHCRHMFKAVTVSRKSK